MYKQRILSLFLAILMVLTILPAQVLAAGESGSITVNDGTYEGTAEGHGGTVRLRVTISDGFISNAEAIRQVETPYNWGLAEQLLAALIGKGSKEEIDAIDAISGATISSNAIKNAAKDALERAGGSPDPDPNPDPDPTDAQAERLNNLLNSNITFDKIQGTNTSADYITAHLGSLPSYLDGSGASFANISLTWTSSNLTYMSNSGTLQMRPKFGDEPINLTMTATATKGGLYDADKYGVDPDLPKSISIPLTIAPFTEAESADKAEAKADVEKALTNFVFQDFTNANCDTNNIIRNIWLRTSNVGGVSGVNATWTTSNPEVIKINSAQGLVTRPAMGQPDAEVTLTITAYKNQYSDRKTYTVKVPAVTQAELNAANAELDAVAAALTFDVIKKQNASANAVTSTLQMVYRGTGYPNQIAWATSNNGYTGAEITWETSDAASVASWGTVTRPTAMDKNVTMTATLKLFYLETYVTPRRVEIPITVRKNAASAAVSSITLSPSMDFAFDAATKTYTLTAPTMADKVTATVVAQESATLITSGAHNGYGELTFDAPLAAGQNTITISTKALDGADTDSYTLNITHTAENKQDAEINALLTAIAESYKNTASDWAAMAMAAYGKKSDVAGKTIVENARETYEDGSKTDLARTIITLTALGVDASHVYSGSEGSYLNFIQKLEASAPAQNNEAAFGLLALDSGAYADTGLALSRTSCTEYLLSHRLTPSAGQVAWAITGNTPDIDVTAMAICALAPYYNHNTNAKAAIDGALSFLSSKQNTSGHYGNSNSTAMVIVAMVSLGKDPSAASGAFTKNGKSLMDGLLTFKTASNQFGYTDHTVASTLSTEQGFRALVAFRGFAYANKSAYNIYRFGAQTGDGTNLTGESNGGVTPPDPNAPKSIKVRVENLYAGTTLMPETTVSLSGTHLDALKAALSANGKNPDTSLSATGGFVSSLLGVSGGTSTGWMYAVNGEIPATMLSETQIAEGDRLVLFFIDWYDSFYFTTFEKESTTIKAGQSVTLTLTGVNPWDVMGGGGAYTPMSGATVYAVDSSGSPIAGVSAKTGADGKATLGFPKAGTYVISAKRDGAKNATDLVPPLCKVTVSSELSGTITVTDVNTPIVGTIASNQDAVLSLTTSGGSNKTATLPEVSISKAVGNNAIAMDITQGTTVTGSSGWNGEILLPKVVPLSLAGKDVAMAIEVGASVDLTFDQPVRLVFPGMAGKKVGFVGESGAFTEITNNLSGDTAATLGGANDGKFTSGGNLVIWTKHFTKFAVYSENAGGGQKPDGNTNITVTVSVTGDSAMGTLFSGYSVTVSGGSSAWDAIKKALNDKGISYSNPTGNYIKKIGSLAEFDRGPNSGWTYLVNGSAPALGVGDYPIQNGDVIKVIYTSDYTTGTSFGSKMGGRLPLNAVVSGIDLKKGLDRLYQKAELNDWEAFVLAVNGYKLKDSYMAQLLKDFKDINGTFRLATDYARLALTLKASGRSITSFGGYNILDKIANNADMGRQGVNGYIFSLIAMTGETLPKDSLWNSANVIEKILEYQKNDGGFALSLTGTSDVDITAMALTALSAYKSQARVKTAIDKGLRYLKAVQKSDGHFAAGGDKNCESVAQVIIALSALGIDPKGSDFAKDGKTPLDILSLFKLSDESFAHTVGGKSNDMATEQALMAVTAYNLYASGKGSLFQFTADIASKENPNTGGYPLCQCE